MTERAHLFVAAVVVLFSAWIAATADPEPGPAGTGRWTPQTAAPAVPYRDDAP